MKNLLSRYALLVYTMEESNFYHHLMTEKGTNVKPLVPNRKGGKTHELVQLMEQKSLLYNLCVHTDVLLLSMI